jgi:hypothetical protein
MVLVQFAHPTRLDFDQSACDLLPQFKLLDLKRFKTLQVRSRISVQCWRSFVDSEGALTMLLLPNASVVFFLWF